LGELVVLGLALVDGSEAESTGSIEGGGGGAVFVVVDAKVEFEARGFV